MQNINIIKIQQLQAAQRKGTMNNIAIYDMHWLYPFQRCKSNAKENMQVLVRKVYQTTQMQKQQLRKRLSIFQGLKNETMIKLESTKEQDDSIHLFFQHIPIKLETWLKNINQKLIGNVRSQILKFSSFLANNGIQTKLSLRNIGMDNNYKAKYFLDLDFIVCNHLEKVKLKSEYIRQIMKLFKPYFKESIKTQQVQQLINKTLKIKIPFFQTFQTKYIINKKFRQTTKVSSNAQSFDINSSKGILKNNDKKQSRNQQWNISNDSQSNCPHCPRQFVDGVHQNSKGSSSGSSCSCELKNKTPTNLTQSYRYRLSKAYNEDQDPKRHSDMNIIHQYFKNDEKMKLKMRVTNVIQKSMKAITKFKSIDWKCNEKKSVVQRR